MDPLGWLSSGLVGLLVLGSGYHYVAQNNAEKEILELQTDLAECKLQKITCNNALTLQNRKVKQLGTDYNATVVELEEWKAKPPVVKYRTIYEAAKDVNLSQGDCNATSDLIDSLKLIDLNTL
jgi:hypothetical protein